MPSSQPGVSRAVPLPHRRGPALLALLVALTVLLMALYVLASSWLAGLTITEWRGAPAGAQLDIFFDEPAHPAWSW
jgi:hypothetical protein